MGRHPVKAEAAPGPVEEEIRPRPCSIEHLVGGYVQTKGGGQGCQPPGKSGPGAIGNQRSHPFPGVKRVHGGGRPSQHQGRPQVGRVVGVNEDAGGDGDRNRQRLAGGSPNNATDPGGKREVSAGFHVGQILVGGLSGHKRGNAPTDYNGRGMVISLNFVIRAGILFLLPMPLIITTQSLFPYISGKELYAWLLIEILTALWLFLVWSDPKYRPPRSLILIALFLSLLASLFAAVAGVSFTRSLWSTYARMGGVIDLAHWTAYVIVLGSMLRTMRDWRLVLNAALVINALMAVVGVIQFYGGPLPQYMATSGVRIGGTLGNPTFLGAYLLVNIFIALALLGDSFSWARPDRTDGARETAQGRRPRSQQQRRSAREQRRRSSYSFWADPPAQTVRMLHDLVMGRGLWPIRIWWIAVIGISIWALALTGTRGAFFGLVAGLLTAGIAYIAWGQHTRLRQASAVLFALMVIGAALVGVLRDSSLATRVAPSIPIAGRFASETLETGSSFKSRVESISAGFSAFAEKPILGWGPENYTVAFDLHTSPAYYEHASAYLDKAHNKILEELVTKGALGLLAYLALWAALVWVLLLKIRGRSRESFFFIAILAALVGYFVQNLFLFDNPAPLLMFMTLAGLAAAVEGHMLTAREKPRLPLLGWWRGPDEAATPEAAAGRRSPLAGRLARLRNNPSWMQATTIGIALVLAGLTSFLIVRSVYQPWKASTSFTPVLTTASLEALSWPKRAEKAQLAFSIFPQLANKGRMFFSNTVSGQNWATVREEDREFVVAIAEEELYRGLEQEPKNLRLNLSLAQLYMAAGSIDPAFLDQAQEQLDIALALAPHRTQVLAAREKLAALQAEPDEP